MPLGIGIPELLIVLAIVLLIFANRLPALGRQLGSGFREFRDSIRKRDEEPGKDELEAGETPVAAGPRVSEEKTPLDGEVVRERS